MWKEAAKAYQKIPEMYPAHSMADDGYALAGIGFQEAGDLESALSLWEQQVKTFPEGDLVGEGYWRLAWTSFLQGDTNSAIEWAQEAQQVVPESGHPYQYFAFPYWEARWKVYPSNSEHGTQNSDPNQVAEGIELWKALVAEHPSEFYSLLAAGHLWELAESWMAEPTSINWKTSAPKHTWTLPIEIGQSTALIEAAQLNRLGLFDEAQTTFAPLKNTSVTTFSMNARLVAEEKLEYGTRLAAQIHPKASTPHLDCQSI